MTIIGRKYRLTTVKGTVAVHIRRYNDNGEWVDWYHVEVHEKGCEMMGTGNVCGEEGGSKGIEKTVTLTCVYTCVFGYKCSVFALTPNFCVPHTCRRVCSTAKPPNSRRRAGNVYIVYYILYITINKYLT